jgi:hypothetical protein
MCVTRNFLKGRLEEDRLLGDTDGKEFTALWGVVYATMTSHLTITPVTFTN